MPEHVGASAACSAAVGVEVGVGLGLGLGLGVGLGVAVGVGVELGLSAGVDVAAATEGSEATGPGGTVPRAVDGDGTLSLPQAAKTSATRATTAGSW